ncbi:hypothetical protein AYO38_02405 [bacterium SCGC AG-212-C10]|nr:hypothetical protein AYO38_02405 [bacterium SCGC AG-212-C10]
MSADIWLITGAQASGKSTIADLLARQFERGVHVRGGQFYRWAVRGWVHVGDDAPEEEIVRNLRLRYRLSALSAAEYADADFTTVVQDNIYGQDVAGWLDLVAPRPRYLVVLRPSVDIVSARDAARTTATGKIAYRGDFTPAINDLHVASTPHDLGLWLDTSSQTPEETVANILARQDQARVPTNSNPPRPPAGKGGIGLTGQR